MCRESNNDSNVLHGPSLDLGREIRQAPDSQEVFLYPDSSISIIVEVLERVAENDDEEAAKFYSLPTSPAK